MYSRIIELSDRRLSPEERMTRLDVPDWFFDSVADCVAQTEASRPFYFGGTVCYHC